VAQLDEVVAGLDDGLDTLVGRGGIRLSGGQRQRLAVARMVLADPKVVILDEATSALDSATEARLHSALEQFPRGSHHADHRPSTQRRAPRGPRPGARARTGCRAGRHEDLIDGDGLYAALYAAQEINLAQAELGKKLYFDPRLSKSGFISCNSCHNLSMGGTDNLPTSIGDHWQQGPINSPTVLNSSLSVAQFWDGRAADLKEQAGGPIANPGEMGFTHDPGGGRARIDPGYVNEFKLVFGEDGIDIDKVTEAIAEFEETLVTPNSRFDQWLLGTRTP
jgi:hypothetical protein